MNSSASETTVIPNSTSTVSTTKKSKTVIFVRHGQAEHNVGYLDDGEEAYFSEKYKNSRLTSLGEKQALDLGRSLKLLNILDGIDLILTSPLERTLQTTRCITAACDAQSKPKIVATEDAREYNYQHPCNARKTKTEMIKVYDDVDFSLIEHEEDKTFQTGDTVDRRDSLMKTIREIDGNTIMIVTHASFLLSLLDKFYSSDKVSAIGNCEYVIKHITC